ncbi:GGDEF domain-containing protein [Sphingomonas quercus]|uniref:diguanylate cyclase n=1 Tax=Sphingomonas quercus TaxID=2842451 RepID=A0ABS6BE84_9SPHN|nr:GGDEF domain-containing protein [Sphingomonas quercus]MBU3076623.1 GGDEF domain-containing protein [Sphingomonas quercus]
MRAVLALLLALLGSFSAGVAGRAATPVVLRIGAPLCHAITPRDAPPPAAAAYRCTGTPQGYQRGTLWLRATLTGETLAGHGMSLLVHQTRFDRATTWFDYADGVHIETGTVLAGNYGDLWRLNGQVAFAAPGRRVPVTAVTLRFDGLASSDLLRIRLLPADAAGREVSLASALVGGGLSLLLLGALYSLSLAVAARQAFMAWHAAWAGSVFLWGTIWSQAALTIVPGIAGTAASQACTFLSTLAIACATACAIKSIPAGVVPRWLRWAALMLGGAVALCGTWAATLTDGRIAAAGVLLSVLVLSLLAAVAAAIALAWRRGSRDARDFAFAWVPAMITLALTQIFDFDTSLMGGGSQVAVLIASALQTAWLSIAVTLRLSRLRSERDAARTAQRELDELSRRDSLTGLFNRRGFIARATATLESEALGLLLIDIDHFKRVNDSFGHDAGDAVLQGIAACLREWEDEHCFAGRMGGEEFVLGMHGLAAGPLLQHAEQVREAIARCPHEALADGPGVTASIGVAAGPPGASFRDIYKAADQALYEAKRLGRNRAESRATVTSAGPPPPQPERRASL